MKEFSYFQGMTGTLADGFHLAARISLRGALHHLGNSYIIGLSGWLLHNMRLPWVEWMPRDDQERLAAVLPEA